MANTKISDFTAATALADTDLFVTGQEDASNEKLTGLLLGREMARVLSTGSATRSKFRWLSVTQIYIGSGEYHHEGTANQIVYWDSELTYTVVTNGAPDWVYIYLDDSAIVTAGVATITASEITDNATEPTWNAAKKGWYNGLDRCIFAVYLVANDVVEFFHDGDMVFHADEIENQAAIDIDAVFTDIGALIIPKFTTIGICKFEYNVFGQLWSWRTNGSAGAVGTSIGLLGAASGQKTIVSDIKVKTDGSQIIEVAASSSDTAKIIVDTQGWKFGVGM